jgi:hypothetical protein
MVITIRQRHDLHLRLGTSATLQQISCLQGTGHARTCGLVQEDLPSHHLKVREANINAMKNPNQKVSRLEKKETKLVRKGMKAVDEGREKKADRLFGRAAKTENRLIKAKKK